MSYRNVITSFLITFLVFFSLPAAAQEKVPRNLMIDISETDEKYVEEAVTLKEYIKVAVSEKSEVVLTDSEEEADAVLSVRLTEAEQGISITIEGDDLLAEEEVFSIESGYPEFSLISVHQDIMQGLIDKIQTEFPPRDPEVVEVVKEKVVEEVEVKQIKEDAVLATIEAEPGTVITTDTGESYTVDESGSITVDLPYDMTVKLTAVKKGYYPVKKTLVIGQEDAVYSLKQRKLCRWGVDVRARLVFMALGAYGMFYYYPGYGYISLGLESSLSLRLLIYENPVFISPVLSTGWYFFKPESIFRIAVSGGVFTRIVIPYADFPIYISRMMPFGFQVGGLVELSPFDRVRFYLEYTPRFFFSELQHSAVYYNNYLSGQIIEIAEGFYFHSGLLITLGVRVLF